MRRKKQVICRAVILLIGSGIYALLFSLGSQVETIGFTRISETATRFCIAFPVAVTALYCLTRVLWSSAGIVSNRTCPSRNGFPVYGAGLFLILCWFPMFLIEYPGSFMYDTQRQVFQIAKNSYDAFHPLLHTLMMRACLSMFSIFQSIEKCAALYSIIQMLVLAICFAEVSAAIARITNKKAGYLTVAFFAFYPSHMAMACNYIKDVLFSGFFSLFLALAMEWNVTGEMPKKRIVCMIASGALSCLMRNNMIYAFAAWMVYMALQKYGRRLAIIALAAVLIATGVNEGMIRILDAKRGSVGEMLSVPVQQLARARRDASSSFTEIDASEMDAFFRSKGWEKYEPTLSDPVKADLNEEYLIKNMKPFFELWIRIGKRCPTVYMDAWCHLILPSIYPYSTYRVAQPYIETGLQPGVVAAPFAQPPMQQPRRFEKIREWLSETIYATGADRVPVLRWLMNTGVVFWGLLALLLMTVYYRGWKYFNVLILPLFLYGTYLLGPVMQGRYLYPFICVLPMFVLSAINACKTQREIKNED